jgi:serine/threonine-protein kinase RsbW
VRSREQISDSSVRKQTAGDVVLLTVPLKPEYFQLVRLAAAGLGAHAALDQELTDDLKLAVSEACACLLRSAEDGEVGPGEKESVINVRFELSADGWEIRVSADGVSSLCGLDSTEFSPLSEEALRVKVMQALVDEVESVADEGGLHYLRLRKGFS